MDNLVSISNVKENILEFNVVVNGIDTDDIAVRFVIESAEMDLGFDSVPGEEENQWSVKIPALSMLDTTSYPFRIDIIVDGYHFDAMKGSVNVVGSHDIYASAPENITLNPAKKKKKAKEIVKKVEAKKTETPKKIEPKKVEAVKVEEPKKVVVSPDENVEIEKTVVKPNKKFEMTPLKVKDSGELFKSLNADKKPERKTDDTLDDKIIGLMKKAKTEQAAPKKETKPVVKKAAPKKKITTKKKVIKKTAPKKEEPKAKEITKEAKTTAKSMAEKIIQTVTGLGIKKEDVIETKDDKIKQIITEDSQVSAKRKAGRPRKVQDKKQPSPIKKIAKDNTIIEIDESKEQSVKDALKEVDESNKKVTTKPLKKKDVTFH